MTNIVLTPVNSGYNLVGINANFDLIEDTINSHVLGLDNGSNTMAQAIDMNSWQIINLADGVFDGDAVNLGQVKALIASGSGNGTGSGSTQDDDSDLETRIGNAEDELSDHEDRITANTSGIVVLQASVTENEGNITSQSQLITTLQSSVSDLDNSVSGQSTAIDSLTSRVTTNEGNISSNATALTNLQVQVNAIDAGTGGEGAAISALDARVTTNEGNIASNTDAITSLQSSVSETSRVLVQDTAPDPSTVTAGDIWINTTNNANILNIFDGTNWVVRQDNTRNHIYVQASAPATANTGDLWFDSDDGNTEYAWDGTQWALIDNAKLAANASAITTLTNDVTGMQGTVTSNSEAITSLQDTVNDSSTGVVANATAITNLTTRVSSVEGVNTSQATSITNLTSSVGKNTSSITTQQTSINGLLAQIGVTLDVNGYVTGWKANNNGSSGTFQIVTDKFAIVAPAGGARTEYSGGNWRVYDSNGVLRVRLGVW